MGAPPYSPDVHPCDFNAFNHLKRELEKNSYQNFDELSTAINNVNLSLSQKRCFLGVQSLPERWQRVVENEGNYI